MRRSIAIGLALLLLLGSLSGCSRTEQTLLPELTAATEPTQPAPVDLSLEDGDMFTQRDRDPGFEKTSAVTVRLEGSTATASSDSVRINGSTVVLSQEATYILSGSLTDGSIVVDAPETAKLQLVLDGVDITSATSAALYIREADKVFVTLAEGSANSLTNGGSFVAVDEYNIDAALFSRQDLTLNGGGTLSVASPAGHGIVCKDDLVITGGSYFVHSASHGIDANDSVRLTDMELTVDAGKDAIHCENSEDAAKGFVYLSAGSVTAEAEGDGISASGYLRVTGGSVQLLVGGGSANGSKERSEGFGGFRGGPGGGRPGQGGFGEPMGSTTQESGTSMKGIKAANSIFISGGALAVDSADDAIHSDTSVTVSGGELTLASGDDAIHAEDTLTVTDGSIEITESYEGLEALHIDIQAGDISLIADDDGLNAAGGADQSGFGGRDGMFGGRGGKGGPMSANSDGTIRISGGRLYVRASGDGIDANGSLEITGGYTVVEGPTQGDTATLDYDLSAVITGGTFIGSGAYGMAQTFSQAGQGVLTVSVGNRAAGTTITLTDTAGNLLLEHTPKLDFALVILTAPELVKGQTYTVTVGTDSGQLQAE